MTRRGVRGAPIPVAERFAARLQPNGECLEWQGSRNAQGYGTIHAGSGRHAIKTHLEGRGRGRKGLRLPPTMPIEAKVSVPA
jgi:hypothetical protein